jgi:hypothetical protein
MRDVNTPQIIDALNKSQEDIATLEDLIEADQILTIATGQTAYPLGFQSGQTFLSIVKRVVSIEWPDTWNYPMQWLTMTQFADKISVETHLIFPKYVTIRNNCFEIFGPPAANQQGTTIKLHNYLRKQTADMSFSYEPEINSSYDQAMRMYAVWFNLPIDHPQKDIMEERYTNARLGKASVSGHKLSQARSSIPNW